jgi:hypothetical protein
MHLRSRSAARGEGDRQNTCSDPPHAVLEALS